ncbi:hypothetical protein V2J81_23335 [Pseudomonas alliivorans]|nr:hypothetical protein [Pseudomonas alliivorans]
MKISPEAEQRAINLSDAAARASDAGHHELAEKFKDAASDLLTEVGKSHSAHNGQTFEGFAAKHRLNVERLGGAFVSKHTQGLYECWQAAGGAA